MIFVYILVTGFVSWFLGKEHGQIRERKRLLTEGITLVDLERVLGCRFHSMESVYFNGRWFEMPSALREEIRQYYESYNPMKREFEDAEYDSHFRR